MLKRIMVALAGLFLMLSLAAAPANGGNSASGSVTLYEKTNFDTTGPFVVVQEVDIPSSCSLIPASLSTVRSAKNNTSGPGTTVEFFAKSDTNCSNAIAPALGPSGTDPNIQDPSNLSQGAGRWMIASS